MNADIYLNRSITAEDAVFHQPVIETPNLPKDRAPFRSIVRTDGQTPGGGWPTLRTAKGRLSICSTSNHMLRPKRLLEFHLSSAALSSDVVGLASTYSS